jgi:hypothetical protein
LSDFLANLNFNVIMIIYILNNLIRMVLKILLHINSIY